MPLDPIALGSFAPVMTLRFLSVKFTAVPSEVPLPGPRIYE